LATRGEENRTPKRRTRRDAPAASDEVQPADETAAASEPGGDRGGGEEPIVFDLDADLGDPGDVTGDTLEALTDLDTESLVALASAEAEGPDASQIHEGGAGPVGEEADQEGDPVHTLPDAETGPKASPDAATEDSPADRFLDVEQEHALDLVGAFDLGPETTPEERDRLLAEALAHAAMQDARYRVPVETRHVARVKGVVALALFVLAGSLAVAPPALVRPTPPATPEAADLREGVAGALLLQAKQIEAFRARTLRLPATLDEVDARLPDIRYVRSSGRLYQLVGYTPTGEAVVYDSSAPASDFTRLEARWLAADGS